MFFQTFNQTSSKSFTQRLFGLGDADSFELVLLFGLGAVESVLCGGLMSVHLFAPRLLIGTWTEHLRQQRATPASSTLQREHTVFTPLSTFILFAFGVSVSGRGPPSVCSRVQRDFVEVDGADGPDVCAEARVGVIVAGQQPVWKHGAGGGGSEVSGLCVSVHWDVQQRGEGPGGVGPLLGPPGPRQTEPLQLLQQVALLLHLLSIVELKASPVIWTKTPRKYQDTGKKSKICFQSILNIKPKGRKSCWPGIGVMRRRLGARPDIGERRRGVRTAIQRREESITTTVQSWSVCYSSLSLYHTHWSDTWGCRRPRPRWESPCCWTYSGQTEEAASWGARKTAESSSVLW